MISRWLRLLAILIWVTAAAGSNRRPRGKKKLEPHTLEHFEAFCRKFIVLDNGSPFELEPFQRTILRGYFAGVTELLVLLPKKNGKTTLLAALALYHLIYTENAACYIAASTKEQAAILYQQAFGFVERKGANGQFLPQAIALRKRVLLRKGTKEIRSRRDSGFIKVISGDKDTGDGVIPTLALVDELHRHKDNGELYGVLADGLGPRSGQIITISTAGESHRSALGRIREKALAYPGATREGKYTFVRSPGGEFELHEWSLDDDDDRQDLELVKLANPLSVNTIARLRQRRDSPTMTPSRWARFGCGVWVQGEDAAYSVVDWNRNGRDDLKLEPGTEVYLGLDIGWRWDTTAIVPCEPYERENVEIDGSSEWWRFSKVRFGKPRILTPPRNGQSMAREKIIKAILAFRDEDELVIKGIVFDRNAEGEAIAQELENDYGFEAIEHSQDPSPMADSSMSFGQALGDDQIEHPNDPEFTAHVMAAKAKTVAGERWRIVPPEHGRGQRKRGHQETGPVEVIDAAVAAVMVRNVATAPHPPERVPLVAIRRR